MPIRLKMSGVFFDVAASLSLGVRKGIDVGIGLDTMIGDQVKIIGVQAHVGFEAAVSRRFYIFGRLGLGVLVILAEAPHKAIPEGNHADMYLRPELGIGWNIKGFNIRLSLASFTLNLGLTDYTGGPSGFYYPFVWLGYRF